VVLIALALLFDFITDDTYHFLPGERPAPSFAVLMGVLSLTYPTMGALITSRLPSNPIGWIFCGAGLLYGVHRFTVAYADYALLMRALPWGEYVAWFSNLVGLAGWGLAAVFLMLMFPDGRLPSRRWQIVAWTVVCGAALIALSNALTPGPLQTHYYVSNPFGVSEVIGGGFTTYDVFPALLLLGTLLLTTCSLAALFSLVLRLRRVRGDERQQLKWFLYAAVPAAVGLNLILFQSIVANFTTNFLFDRVDVLPSLEVSMKVTHGALFALLVLPVFTYIAILRHRLYDIDVVINRTLVYGALTASVVGVYVLAVGGLGALFQAQGNLGVSLLATGSSGLPVPAASQQAPARRQPPDVRRARRPVRGHLAPGQTPGGNPRPRRPCCPRSSRRSPRRSSCPTRRSS
jgi:hypothetical protein